MKLSATTPLVNNFFYKFYNYNVEDRNMICKVPTELYGYVLRELTFYKKNIAYSSMNQMQFNSFLFNLIKINYLTLHEQLLKDLKA